MVVQMKRTLNEKLKNFDKENKTKYEAKKKEE